MSKFRKKHAFESFQRLCLERSWNLKAKDNLRYFLSVKFRRRQWWIGGVVVDGSGGFLRRRFQLSKFPLHFAEAFSSASVCSCSFSFFLSCSAFLSRKPPLFPYFFLVIFSDRPLSGSLSLDCLQPHFSVRPSLFLSFPSVFHLAPTAALISSPKPFWFPVFSQFFLFFPSKLPRPFLRFSCLLLGFFLLSLPPLFFLLFFLYQNLRWHPPS